MGDRADSVTLDHLQCLRVLHGEVADLDHLGQQSNGGDCLDSLDPLFLLRARSWLLRVSSLLRIQVHKFFFVPHAVISLELIGVLRPVSVLLRRAASPPSGLV